MQYRFLGESEPRPSAIGFGVWTVSTSMWGITDDAFGAKLLRQALDLGINCFDTADVYGDGKGETLLADALGGRRDEAVIATKFGYDFSHYPGVQEGHRERPQNWTPAFVRRACEQSLARLRTDRIDLYQLHNPRLDALQSDDLFAELEALKSEGKILRYGAALGPALKPDRQVEEALFCIRERKAPVQIIYNLLEQVLGEAAFPAAREANVPVFVRVPHASGILEGRFNENTDFGPNDHRSFRLTTDSMRRSWLLDGLKKVEKLTPFIRERCCTPGQFALQFILAEPSVTSVFPNIYNEEQLREFAAAPDTPPLTPDDMAELKRLYVNNFYIGDSNK